MFCFAYSAEGKPLANLKQKQKKIVRFFDFILFVVLCVSDVALRKKEKQTLALSLPMPYTVPLLTTNVNI